MCDFSHARFEICSKWDRRAGGLAGISDDGTGGIVDCGGDIYGLGEITSSHVGMSF